MKKFGDTMSQKLVVTVKIRNRHVRFWNIFSIVNKGKRKDERFWITITNLIILVNCMPQGKSSWVNLVGGLEKLLSSSSFSFYLFSSPSTGSQNTYGWELSGIRIPIWRFWQVKWCLASLGLFCFQYLRISRLAGLGACMSAISRRISCRVSFAIRSRVGC